MIGTYIGTVYFVCVVSCFDYILSQSDIAILYRRVMLLMNILHLVLTMLAVMCSVPQT